MANQTLIQSSHPDHAVARIPDAADVGGSAGIAAQLRRSIVEGAYGFSDRLPAERHLAETFDVSRGTIREALRRLEELGMVTREIGSGTFVTYREFAEQTAIADVTSPLDLPPPVLRPALIPVRLTTSAHGCAIQPPDHGDCSDPP